MKQIITISILLIFIHIIGFAQNFVSENKLWSNTTIGSEFGSNYESFFVKFKGDTIINGQNYKNVLKSDNEDHTNWYHYAYIREDTIEKKVYLYKIFFEKEILLYDFSLDQGDSIDCFGEYIHVDSVYYHEFGNLPIKLKHIVFNYGRIWVEGIGSLRGVLLGIPELPLSVGEIGRASCRERV